MWDLNYVHDCNVMPQLLPFLYIFSSHILLLTNREILPLPKGVLDMFKEGKLHVFFFAYSTS